MSLMSVKALIFLYNCDYIHKNRYERLGLQKLARELYPEDEINRCTHCGGEAFCERHKDFDLCWDVQCSICHGKTLEYETKEKAIESWNHNNPSQEGI